MQSLNKESLSFLFLSVRNRLKNYMQEKTVFQPGQYPKLVSAIKMHDLEGFGDFYDRCSTIFYGYIKKSLYRM